MNLTLEEVYEKLDGIKRNDFSLENQELHNYFKILEKEALGENRYRNLSSYKHNKLCNKFKKYEKMGEFYIAKQFLETGKVPKNHMIERTIKNAKIEGDYANITSSSKILFIGSGPYPETAITLQKIYKCNVDCVDKCKKSVDISKKVIEKMNLNQDINIYYGLGEEMIYNNYTHIFIAAHVEKKENIVKNIDTGKIILARFGEENRSFIYSTFEFMEYFGDKIKILGELRNRKQSIHSTVIFEIIFKK